MRGFSDHHQQRYTAACEHLCDTGQSRLNEAHFFSQHGNPPAVREMMASVKRMPWLLVGEE